MLIRGDGRVDRRRPSPSPAINSSKAMHPDDRPQLARTDARRPHVRDTHRCVSTHPSHLVVSNPRRALPLSPGGSSRVVAVRDLRTMKKGAKVGPRDARDSPRVPRSSPARDPLRPSSRPTRSARANARPSPTPPPSLTHHLAVPSPSASRRLRPLRRVQPLLVAMSAILRGIRTRVAPSALLQSTRGKATVVTNGKAWAVDIIKDATGVTGKVAELAFNAPRFHHAAGGQGRASHVPGIRNLRARLRGRSRRT